MYLTSATNSLTLPRLTFYHPNANFGSISITGTACARNCAHCGGHYLKGMTAVSSPEDLYRMCLELRDRGGLGALVSGGCDLEGRIDFRVRHVENEHHRPHGPEHYQRPGARLDSPTVVVEPPTRRRDKPRPRHLHMNQHSVER